jgi:hypothetical protein
VTLPRLLLAWLPVAVLFAAVRWAARRWLGAPTPAGPGSAVAAVRAPALEAAGVTLFASLWFDSLGAGEWWLLFLLVGGLVAFAPRLRDATSSAAPTPRVALGLADVARYVAAGAVLAWRLQ